MSSEVSVIALKKGPTLESVEVPLFIDCAHQHLWSWLSSLWDFQSSFLKFFSPLIDYMSSEWSWTFALFIDSSPIRLFFGPKASQVLRTATEAQWNMPWMIEWLRIWLWNFTKKSHFSLRRSLLWLLIWGRSLDRVVGSCLLFRSTLKTIKARLLINPVLGTLQEKDKEKEASPIRHERAYRSKLCFGNWDWRLSTAPLGHFFQISRRSTSCLPAE